MKLEKKFLGTFLYAFDGYFLLDYYHHMSMAVKGSVPWQRTKYLNEINSKQKMCLSVVDFLCQFIQIKF